MSTNLTNESPVVMTPSIIQQQTTPAALSAAPSFTTQSSQPASQSKKPVKTTLKLSDLYTLGHQIGKGGYATVYQAVQKETGRKVAVKKMAKVREGKCMKNQAVAEAKAMKCLKHQSFVQCL